MHSTDIRVEVPGSCHEQRNRIRRKQGLQLAKRLLGFGLRRQSRKPNRERASLSHDAFRLDQVLPLKAESPGVCQLLRWPLPGLPLAVDPYSPAFGDDPNLRLNASPIFHARRGLPPFLIVHAEDDLPTLPEMARNFHRALSQIQLTADFRVRS